MAWPAATRYNGRVALDPAFRPMAEDDLPRLVTWFADPVVARWFGPPKDQAAVEQKYGPRLRGDDPTEMWIGEYGGEPAAMLQCYRHVDHPETDAVVGVSEAVGIDYLLSASFRGRGLAGPLLAAFATHALARFRDCTVVVATPHEANAASCGALRAAGFERSHVTTSPTGEREVVFVHRPVGA